MDLEQDRHLKGDRQLKIGSKERLPLSGEDVIRQYFKCIDSKDLSGLLDLFEYDAVIREPFSNVPGGLRGRSSIEPFLKVAMMANSSLRRTVKIEKAAANKVTALITFEKGDRVKAKFTFTFEDSPEGKRIKLLEINFL